MAKTIVDQLQQYRPCPPRLAGREDPAGHAGYRRKPGTEGRLRRDGRRRHDGGPAEKAKIRNGDIILKFDGQDVKEMHNLPRIVADSDVGKEVPVVLWRDGKEVTVQTTLAERPADAQLAAADAGKPADVTKPTDISELGLKVAPVSQDLKDKFQLQRWPERRGHHRRVAEHACGRPWAEAGRRHHGSATG